MSDPNRRDMENCGSDELSTGCDPPVTDDSQLAEQKPRAPQHAASHRHPKKKKRMHPLVRFVVKLAALAGIVAVMFTFVLGLHIQHGNTMHPYIMDGDLLLTYKLDIYRVGDAVAYRNPKTGQTAVSRIVAVGRNEIQITEIGELLINGSIPDENVFFRTEQTDGSEITFPYQMTSDGYFLLDDHRTIGSDSRVFGEVTKDDLLGKVVYVLRRRGI